MSWHIETFQERMMRVKKLSDLADGNIHFPAKVTRATALRILVDLKAAEATITRLLRKR